VFVLVIGLGSFWFMNINLLLLFTCCCFFFILFGFHVSLLTR